MKFKTQSTLRLISQYPLIILFLFSTYFLYLSYEQYNKAVMFENKLNTTEVLSNLSIAVAKERGLSSTFIASDGAIAEETLKKQRQLVNANMKKFHAFYQSHEANHRIKKVITLLNQISDVRKKIDSLNNINFNKIFFEYYSQINAQILQELQTLAEMATTSRIVNLSASLITVYKDIEYSGQERGFVSKVLSQYVPFTDSDLDIWIGLFSKSNTFDYTILQDGIAKSKINAIYSTRETKKLISEIKQAKAELILAAQNGEYLIDPTLWFNLITKKIGLLNDSTKAIKLNLNDEMKLYYNETFGQLIGAGGVWIISLILMFVGFILSGQFKNNVKGLENIFRKVGELAETEEKVDFNTATGMTSAYAIINQAIENISKEKVNAEEASAAKSIFLANMSHEIRTPLNGIIGFTELLKNTDLDDEKREFVDVIEKSSENLLDIINSILDLSKVESNKIEIDEILFSPLDEFENAVEVYGPKAAEKNINLSFFIDPSLNNYLKGDSTKVKEVMINLMSNAVKFTPINGHITAEIRRIENAPAGKARILFSVQDSGIGISEDKRQDIFDAFNQADSTITRKYGGTGLGLTISSKFINLMDGELKVDSVVGEGSKFYFVLEFDESPSGDVEFQNKFSNFNVALLTRDIDTKVHAEFMYDYLKYFGSNVKYYDEFSGLKNLIYKSGINLIVADFDLLSNEELEEYKKIRLPMILVLKASHQKRFDEFNTKYITPIYEPINVTKLTKALEQNRELLPKHGIAPEEEQEQVVVTKSAKPSFGKMFDANVLVAEDNEINQKLIRRTLEGLGLTITIAHNGKIALEERMKNDYDAIFMDIAMPVMDGVEATHKIIEYEKQNNLPHIPIIAVTANALKGDRERFMKEGLDEYVTKPIKKESILSVLNMFLQNKIVEETPQENVRVQETPVIEPAPIIQENIQVEKVMEPAPIIHENIQVEKVMEPAPIIHENIQVEKVMEPAPIIHENIQVKKVIEEFKVVEESPIHEKTEIQKNLNIEMIQTQLEEIELPTKDILVYKKSHIETKIFSSILAKLTNSIDSVNSVDELKIKLNKSNYKIVLFDKELSSIGPKEMAALIKETPAIMFVDPITKIEDEDRALFNSVLPNIINKKQLEELVQKFI